MQLFCPRCGGYTPPRSQFCRICGGKVSALRDKLDDVLGAPIAKAVSASLSRSGRSASAAPDVARLEVPEPPPEPEVSESGTMSDPALPSVGEPLFNLDTPSKPQDNDLSGLDSFSLGGSSSAEAPFSFDSVKPPTGGDLGARPSGGLPFDLGSSAPNALESLDLSVVPASLGGKQDSEPAGAAAAPFDLGSVSGVPDFSSLADFGVAGTGKVDFGDLDRSSQSSDKGLFDLDSLTATQIPSAMPVHATAPEPEIDFSLLSNPDKKKVLKSLEELDFSRSELSGSGASKLLDGDLDFTGLSSQVVFKGGEENLYNMDEIPSLGGGKSPSDDPFATLLNQPARAKGKPPSLIDPNDVAEVERELSKVSPAGHAASNGGAVVLVLYQGNRAIKRFPLKEAETTIGQRDDDANIVPDVDLQEYDAAGLVAPLHAKIVREGDKLAVMPCRNSTGTQLNGKALTNETKHPVKSGDMISLGANIVLKLEPA